MAKDHLTPEFLEINPQHTVPTLVDDGFSIWESRAILCYLVEKYGKDDSLYPNDPQKRAVINQRLFFDMGTLYKSFAEYFYPQLMRKEPADDEKLKKMEEAIEFLNIFLANGSYAAGDEPSIADHSLFASISTLGATGYDFSQFENVTRWFELCKSSLPGVEANEEGIEAMKVFIQNM